MKNILPCCHIGNTLMSIEANMNTLTLKVPELLNTKLDKYAKKRGLSKSEIVRIALLDYLSKDDTLLKGSFLDQSEDLAGSIEAPADISSNKDYLKGYGT